MFEFFTSRYKRSKYAGKVYVTPTGAQVVDLDDLFNDDQVKEDIKALHELFEEHQKNKAQINNNGQK